MREQTLWAERHQIWWTYLSVVTGAEATDSRERAEEAGQDRRRTWGRGGRAAQWERERGRRQRNHLQPQEPATGLGWQGEADYLGPEHSLMNECQLLTLWSVLYMTDTTLKTRPESSWENSDTFKFSQLSSEIHSVQNLVWMKQSASEEWISFVIDVDGDEEENLFSQFELP